MMWEVVTLGQQPYPARSNAEVLEYVRTGGTLDRPEQCPAELYVTYTNTTLKLRVYIIELHCITLI